MLEEQHCSHIKAWRDVRGRVGRKGLLGPPLPRAASPSTAGLQARRTKLGDLGPSQLRRGVTARLEELLQADIPPLPLMGQVSMSYFRFMQATELGKEPKSWPGIVPLALSSS